MDPLALAILHRCRTDTSYRSLGTLTRSARGLAPGQVVRTRNKRGVFVHPFMDSSGKVHYHVERGQEEMIDLAGREKAAAFFQREPKVVFLKSAIGPTNRFAAGYIEDRLAVSRGMLVITPHSLEVDAMYLLGLLNSRLYCFLYRHCFTMTYKGELKRVRLLDLRRLPVPLGRPIEKGLINGLVIQILNALEKDPTSDTLEMEHAIDMLVYRLFGLDPAGVKIVEANGPPISKLDQIFHEELLPGDVVSGSDPVAGEATV